MRIDWTYASPTSRAVLAALLGAGIICGHGQAVAAPPAPAQSWSATSPQPAGYAQALVDHELARRPELKILAMHVTPPGGADNVIIASNIGHIGKKADEDDLSVLRSGAPRAEVTRNGYSVELPLKDARGRVIGVLGATFAYAPGDDRAAIGRRAAMVRDELAAAIRDLDALFAPGPPRR